MSNTFRIYLCILFVREPKTLLLSSEKYLSKFSVIDGSYIDSLVFILCSYCPSILYII